MAKIFIRKGSIEDAREIKSIADSLFVKEGTDRNYGFFEYSLNKEQYERRLTNNSFFLVAEREANVEGFCMAYDDVFLDKLLLEEVLCGIEKWVSCNYQRPFVYIDQATVKRPKTFSGGKVAVEIQSGLMQLIRKRRIPRIICGVVLKPWENGVSRKFVEHMSYKKMEEKELEGLTFGIYQLDLWYNSLSVAPKENQPN